MDNKKIVIIAAIAILLLLGVAGYLFYSLNEQKAAVADLEQLAELDKKEMENDYAQFALEYDELKKTIRDDSLLTQLEKEQQRARNLLAELKSVKSTNAAEITRLKKELETVRAVLRSYILQVDSLQQANISLTAQRDEARAQYSQATSQINTLNTEKASLSEKVAIAAQLDATAVSILPQKENGKGVKKIKDIARFVVSFTITKNITAATGNRTLYLRLTKPGNEVVNRTATFAYENKQLDCSAQKVIEYNGEEQRVTMYVPVNEYLSAGTFQAHIFADGKMIGSSSLTISK